MATDSDLRETITDALRDVYDPCCADRGLSVVDMGLIDDIRVGDDHATVDLVLTSGWCPFVVPLLDTIRERIAGLDIPSGADVRVVWDRTWSPDRMSEKARQRLQFLPPPNRTGDGGAPTPAAAPSHDQHVTVEVRP